MRWNKERFEILAMKVDEYRDFDINVQGNISALVRQIRQDLADDFFCRSLRINGKRTFRVYRYK